MSIISAGQIIKEARIKANLTQEKLSEGICTSVALSKIENGKLGVSPSTFALLMEKTGSPREALPTFKNQTDYECFSLIKSTNNDIINHQLDNAYGNILKIISMNYADNKYYQQQTMLLYCWLQYSSYNYNASDLKNIICNALNITKPNLNIFDIRTESLSFIEYKGLLLLVNILIDSQQFESAIVLLSELHIFIKNTSPKHINEYTQQINYIHSFSYAKYFYLTGNLEEAKIWIDSAVEMYYSDYVNSFLAYELFILKELIILTTENINPVSSHLEYYIAAASFKGCMFVNNILNHLQFDHSFNETLETYALPPKTYTPIIFEIKELSDGLFNMYDKDVITIGKLIKHLRTEQNISLDKLCSGICSKSMLSKIENNTLTPSIYVIEALLGRLGVSEREFVFYGNEEETKYHDLKFSVLASTHINTATLISSIEDFFNFASSIDNKLVLQQAYCFKASITQNKVEAYNILFDAIKLTYPDFSLEQVNNYILSWTELTIVNGLLKCIYSTNDTFFSNTVFHKILINTDKPPLKNKVFSRNHASTICLFLIFLDINSIYNETLFFINSIISRLSYFDPYCLNFVLYYYSLAKANLEQLDSLEFYSKASIGNALISNDTAVIDHFKEDILSITNLKI